MGDTLKVFQKNKKFKQEKPSPVPRQKVRVSSRRRSAARPVRRTDTARPRAKRTLYEDTINVDRSSHPELDLPKTAAIDLIRARKRSKKIAWSIFIALLVTALAGGMVFSGMFFFFKVESVRCEGITLYDPDEMVARAGVEVGAQLYRVDREGIAARLSAEYPYLKNVRVGYDLPTGVVIFAEEDKPGYYTELAGRYYILSPEMRVLESIPAERQTLEENYGALLRLELPPIAGAVVGSPIRYFNPSSELYINEMIDRLTTGEYADKINSIDLSSRYALSFRYDGRIDVLLGDATELSSKIRFAFAMIDEFSENATGTVSSEDVESGYALIDDPGA